MSEAELGLGLELATEPLQSVENLVWNGLIDKLAFKNSQQGVAVVGRTNASRLLEILPRYAAGLKVTKILESAVESDIEQPIWPLVRRLGDISLGQEVIYKPPQKGSSLVITEIEDIEMSPEGEAHYLFPYGLGDVVLTPLENPLLLSAEDYDQLERSRKGSGIVTATSFYWGVTMFSSPPGSELQSYVHSFARTMGASQASRLKIVKRLMDQD